MDRVEKLARRLCDTNHRYEGKSFDDLHRVSKSALLIRAEDMLTFLDFAKEEGLLDHEHSIGHGMKYDNQGNMIGAGTEHLIRWPNKGEE